MADPLSITGLVLALVDVATKIIKCVDTIKDAPDDIKLLLCEVTSFKIILESIPPESRSSLLRGKGPVLEACDRCLSALIELIPEQFLTASNGGSGKRRHLAVTRLSWLLKESKAKKTLAELAQHKSTLLLLLSSDMK